MQKSKIHTLLPRYLMTTDGHVWVICKKCGEPMPIWQVEDNGGSNQSTFTCPWCAKNAFPTEEKQPAPKFTNLTPVQEELLKKIVTHQIEKKSFPVAAMKEVALRHGIMKTVEALLIQAGMPVNF